MSMTVSKRTLTRSQKLTAVLLLPLVVFVIQAVAQQTDEHPSQSQPHDMRMRMGRGMMGMNDDSRVAAEMGAIHELLVNHDRIKRTVTNLPDGIRTVTESDDPKIAQLIKEHVASMDKRVETQDDPGLPIESPALRTILRNGEKVRLSTEITATGVIVTQTSTDAETVRALQQHASEVTDLVRGGMMALHTGMMKNGSGMHGRMMGQGPNGAPAHNPQEKESQ
jgi:hypothetical protein